ncbi:Imm42 family immunity protein [Achromobacter insuavis]|uniref:Imm42 family immunity protein n=1 Tax=Achromobacter insuavis TaxID=1287735 RepID=UPI002402689B|nr:Imm42 family immunity protein [Achromobacter insuavis]
MEFGDRNRFGVNLDLNEDYGGVWLFGKICYWICGNMVGNYDVEDTFIQDLKKLLLPDGKLNKVEVARRQWQVSCIDDKALFGEDSRRLARAFRSQGNSSFHVARVHDILSEKQPFIVYVFEASERGVEMFQGERFYSINLEDCLFFNIPVTCVTFRPGEVDTTIFAGDDAFIGQITGKSR